MPASRMTTSRADTHPRSSRTFGRYNLPELTPDAVVPRAERGYHPLCAVYTRACLEPITRRLADGRLRVDGLFEDVRVRVVARGAIASFGDPDRLLANLNTPLEYRAIEAKGIQS